MKNADIKVVMRITKNLKPYEGNPKQHTEEAVLKMAMNLEEFGFGIDPIVVDKKGVIIHGHRRWLAAKHLKMPKVPVIVYPGNEDRCRALRLAANRLGEDTPVDELLVAAELKKLDAAEFDTKFTGFEAAERGDFKGRKQPGSRVSMDPEKQEKAWERYRKEIQEQAA